MKHPLVKDLGLFLDSIRLELHSSCNIVSEYKRQISELTEEMPHENPEITSVDFGNIDFLFRVDGLTAKSKSYMRSIATECHDLDMIFRERYDDLMKNYKVMYIHIDLRARLYLLLCNEIPLLMGISPSGACNEFELLAKSILDKAKEISNRN